MTNTLTIVLTRSREDVVFRRKLEAAVLDRLSARADARVLVTPHLYDLRPGGPSVARLRESAGDLVVLAWLAPRAIRGVLGQLGLKGRLVLGAAEEDRSSSGWHALEGRGEHRAGSGEPRAEIRRPTTPFQGVPLERTIWYLDLNRFDEAEEVVQRIETILAGRPSVGSPAPVEAIGETIVESIEEPSPPRWYPVVDAMRCVNCLECFNFCLFGVYGLDASDQVRVEQPDACRPGCPACARVCPAGAILFPEHADPVISGASEAPATPPPPDQAARERDAALAENRDPAAESAPESPPSGGNGLADLDSLVDRIDELDL